MEHVRIKRDPPVFQSGSLNQNLFLRLIALRLLPARRAGKNLCLPFEIVFCVQNMGIVGICSQKSVHAILAATLKVEPDL